jgi:hypothetical protein
MIYCRVEKLEALLEELKNESVTILDKMALMITISLFIFLMQKEVKFTYGKPIIKQDDYKIFSTFNTIPNPTQRIWMNSQIRSQVFYRNQTQGIWLIFKEMQISFFGRFGD